MTAANLDYFCPFNVQLDVSGSQMTLDFFCRRPGGHVDFDEYLLHGLAPRAPASLTGNQPALLVEMHRHFVREDCFVMQWKIMNIFYLAV